MICDQKTFSRQSSPQKFPDSRRTAGHPLVETPIVQRCEFVGAQHNLKPIGTGQVRHLVTSIDVFTAMSKLLNRPRNSQLPFWFQ
jgi:hypothetical protein